MSGSNSGLLGIRNNQLRLIRDVVRHVPIARIVKKACIILMTQAKLGIASSRVDVRLQFRGDVKRLPTGCAHRYAVANSRRYNISTEFVVVAPRSGRKRIRVAVKDVFQYRVLRRIRPTDAVQVDLEVGTFYGRSLQRNNIEIIEKFKEILIWPTA